MAEAGPHRLFRIAVQTNGRTLSAFRYRIIDLWRRSLQRRSQKDRTTWARITKLVNDYLPRVRILHPPSLDRFVVKHPRWEPSARIGLARICAGGAQQ
jgi:RNA-directed DNA polymerase